MDLVKFFMCNLVPRVHRTFEILTKGYTFTLKNDRIKLNEGRERGLEIAKLCLRNERMVPNREALLRICQIHVSNICVSDQRSHGKLG